MNQSGWMRNSLLHAAQSLLLVCGMAALLAFLGWLIGGAGFALIAVAMVLLLYFFNPMANPNLVLRMYRGRVITPYEAPGLYRTVSALSQRAGIANVPALFYLPSDVMNAFAVGDRSRAAVALSDGLLRRLDSSEIAGVLAHEMSHIANNDIGIMSFADLSTRLTRLLSLAGQILLFINLPLILLEGYGVSWLAIAALIFAPTLSALLQLALSRIREYAADMGAARLLGNPRPLARALAKMDHFQGRIFEQIFLPNRLPDTSLLRTHPPTEKRVERLMSLEAPASHRDWSPRKHHLTENDLSSLVQPRRLRPKWHWNGLWY